MAWWEYITKPWKPIEDYAHSKKKHKHRTKKERQRTAKYNKKVEKREDIVWDQQQKFFKKYGGEDFSQYEKLQPGQQKLLDKYLKRGGEPRQKLEYIREFERNKKLGRLSDIEQNPEFQAGRRGLQDILAGGNEAYERFKQPIIEEYKNETLPQIFGQYGGQGNEKFNTATGNVLANSLGGLQSKLGALRAGLQQQARQEVPFYATQPFQNQIQGNAQTLAQNQQNFQRGFGFNQNVLGMNQQRNAANYQNLQAGQFAVGTDPYHTIYRPPAFGNVINPGNYQQPGPPSYSGIDRFLQAAAPGIGQGLGQAAAGAALA